MATPSILIQPGTLRHVITIQQATNTRDAAGQPLSTWSNVLTTRASIDSTVTATYKESFSSNALASQSTYLLTIRWPGTTKVIGPGMRVVFGPITYLIQAVDNVKMRNRVVRLACIVIDGNSN